MKIVHLTMLEFADGRSDKFYNVFTDGNRGIVHWGRRGQRGQTQHVTWSEALERTKEKRNKGYALYQEMSFPYSGSWDVESLLSATVSGPAPDVEYKDQEVIFVW